MDGCPGGENCTNSSRACAGNGNDGPSPLLTISVVGAAFVGFAVLVCVGLLLLSALRGPGVAGLALRDFGARYSPLRSAPKAHPPAHALSRTHGTHAHTHTHAWGYTWLTPGAWGSVLLPQPSWREIVSRTSTSRHPRLEPRISSACASSGSRQGWTRRRAAPHRRAVLLRAPPGPPRPLLLLHSARGVR